MNVRDAERVGQLDDVVGAVLEAERRARDRMPPPVAPWSIAITRYREESGAVRREPVEVGGGAEPWSRTTVGAPGGPGRSRNHRPGSAIAGR